MLVTYIFKPVMLSFGNLKCWLIDFFTFVKETFKFYAHMFNDVFLFDNNQFHFMGMYNLWIIDFFIW